MSNFPGNKTDKKKGRETSIQRISNLTKYHESLHGMNENNHEICSPKAKISMRGKIYLSPPTHKHSRFLWWKTDSLVHSTSAALTAAQHTWTLIFIAYLLNLCSNISAVKQRLDFISMTFLFITNNYMRRELDPWVGKIPGGGHGNPL